MKKSFVIILVGLAAITVFIVPRTAAQSPPGQSSTVWHSQVNLGRFWGMQGRDSNNDRDKWYPQSQPSGDFLPDDQELILVTEAGPYDPLWVHTYLDDQQESDYERHNCNSINAEEWLQGSADTEDWAVPGNQWHP